ncbi:MerR family transcriptional regulator [Clostridium sp. D53t1_180928_C8]|uniref:MerR family transcriptional regulator n=1 Tax=Clostridium sp. D53t1_180928_C8 TaxID=2787101 RepID=UPI0018A90728|nr:MerR family transcriptional regulator [Clostridium sp. D53t1_180928_C8]
MTLDREKYFFTPRYTRGEVSKFLGVTKDTLRHYEECGLINPHENEKNRYKYYSIADLEILNVVLFLRSMDVPISEIPNFIECKDINSYSNFLDEQINKAIKKINYWNNVKNLLSYLKKTLEDYQKVPHKVKVVENISFRFRVAKFDYKNYDIEQMAPSIISTDASSHIIKLKIVDKKWLSNREDTSGMSVGYLCSEEEEGEDIVEKNMTLSLMITTLEPLEKLPEIIFRLWNDNKDKYKFEENVVIVEHTFFNIFNQEALLRNIYLPIRK